MLARTLISDAFRLIGVTRTGQTPSADALADGLSTLNGMLDAWANERLMVPMIVRRVLDLIAGQQTYTIGTAGNWNVPRPMRIEGAGLISGTTETPMDHALTFQHWAAISNKSQSGRPYKLYYDKAFPLGNVSLWPVPDDSSLDVALYCWAPLLAFADLATTQYDLPAGYELALRFNLAVNLIPAFTIQNKSSMQQHVLVMDLAKQYKGNIKMLNAPVYELAIDAALAPRGGFDITTGNYR